MLKLRWVLAVTFLIAMTTRTIIGQSMPASFKIDRAEMLRHVGELGLSPGQRDAVERMHERWLREFDCLNRMEQSVMQWQGSHHAYVFNADMSDMEFGRKYSNVMSFTQNLKARMMRDLNNEYFDHLAAIAPDRTDDIVRFRTRAVRRSLLEGNLKFIHDFVAGVNLDLRELLDRAAPHWDSRDALRMFVHDFEQQQARLLLEGESEGQRWNGRRRDLSFALQKARTAGSPDLQRIHRKFARGFTDWHASYVRLRNGNKQAVTDVMPMLDETERERFLSLSEPILDSFLFRSDGDIEMRLLETCNRKDLNDEQRHALVTLKDRVSADRRAHADRIRQAYEQTIRPEVIEQYWLSVLREPNDMAARQNSRPPALIAWDSVEAEWNTRKERFAPDFEQILARHPKLRQTDLPSDLEQQYTLDYENSIQFAPRLPGERIDSFIRDQLADNAVLAFLLETERERYTQAHRAKSALALAEFVSIVVDRRRNPDGVGGVPDPSLARLYRSEIRWMDERSELERTLTERFSALLHEPQRTQWRNLLAQSRRERLFQKWVHPSLASTKLDLMTVVDPLRDELLAVDGVEGIVQSYIDRIDTLAVDHDRESRDSLLRTIQLHEADDAEERKKIYEAISRDGNLINALFLEIDRIGRESAASIEALLEGDLRARFHQAVTRARNPLLIKPSPIRLFLEASVELDVDLGEHAAAIRAMLEELEAIENEMLDQMLAAHDRWSSPGEKERRRLRVLQLRAEGRELEASEAYANNHPAEPLLRRRFEITEAACRKLVALFTEEQFTALPCPMRLAVSWL